MNLGAVLPPAHTFNAAFAFAIRPELDVAALLRSDTSIAIEGDAESTSTDGGGFQPAHGCRLVGVEITPEAIDLPSFTHPPRRPMSCSAEQDSLSPELTARCEVRVRIPTRFCVNLGIAAAIVMYDRMISLGRFAERPVRAGPPVAKAPKHVHGPPKWKRRRLAPAAGD
jgi:hypothetical protein